MLELHVNFGEAGEAARLARGAVEQRLAACANIHASIRSLYWWQGTVQQADETPVIFKTSEDRVDALMAFIAGEHSYEVPGMIVHKPLTANASYLAWIVGETRRPA